MRKLWWALLSASVLLVLSSVQQVSHAQNTAPSTVNFYTWGGSPAVNNYVRWAARELQRQDIVLRHVKVADIAEVVKQITDGRSQADLIWINGENFHALKQAQALADVASVIDEIDNLRSDINWQVDFGEPVDGLEVPWGVGQFYLLACAGCFEGEHISAVELLHYAQKNPGRLSYPLPPEFHGTTFLKSLLLSLTETTAVFQQDIKEANAEQVTAPLWAYLDQLHPLLWQRGQAFPSSAAEQLNLFAQSQLHMAMSFNPNEVITFKKQGRIPATATAHLLGQGAITNSHYLAIPKQSLSQAAAQQVIAFFLSERAQRRKASLRGWGDVPVIELEESPNLLPPVDDFHASWQDYLEQQWSVRYQ